MDLTSLMSSLLSDQNIKAVASKAGVSEEEAASVLATALPVMLNGANGQASDANTTESFFHAVNDHAKKDPESVDLKEGGKIVGHLLGTDEEAAENAIAKRAGMSSANVGLILAAAAPLILNMLGNSTSSSNSSAGTASLLNALLGGGMNSNASSSLMTSALTSVLGNALGGNSSSNSLLGSLLVCVQLLVDRTGKREIQEERNDELDDLDDNDALDDLTDEQVDAVQTVIEGAINDALEHADDDDDYDPDDEEDEEDYDEEMQHADDDATVEDVFNTLNEEQKKVVYYLLSQVAQDSANSSDTAKHSFDGGFDMKHNVFDDSYYEEDDVLTHDEFNAIMADASNATSLKDVFLEHGIENLDVLFPEARMIRPEPDMITRNMGWVNILWGSIKRTPFSRIKSVAADLTPDAARAKGYVKKNQKVDQVISLLSRETTPQTIYKKQTLDRDDVIDIVDIDVIAWLKQELRLMLNEEICRAILVGDGRGVNDRDKIKEDKVRPIYGDEDVYTIYYEVKYGANDTEDQKASRIVDAAVRARKDYKGTGNPKMFATNEVISDMLLAKDSIGRRLYKDMNELATAMRVSEIVEVPVMEGITRSRNAL